MTSVPAPSPAAASSLPLSHLPTLQLASCARRSPLRLCPTTLFYAPKLGLVGQGLRDITYWKFGLKWWSLQLAKQYLPISEFCPHLFWAIIQQFQSKIKKIVTCTWVLKLDFSYCFTRKKFWSRQFQFHILLFVNHYNYILIPFISSQYSSFLVDISLSHTFPSKSEFQSSKRKKHNLKEHAVRLFAPRRQAVRTGNLKVVAFKGCLVDTSKIFAPAISNVWILIKNIK